MFNIIKNYLIRLFYKTDNSNIYRSKKQESLGKNNIDNEYIGAIAFKLTKNNDIDVLYSLPDTSNKSTDELLNSAEQYANFLMVINQGYLQQDIINIFQNNIKPDSDAKEHLLLDNILVFWAMAELEETKRLNKQFKKHQPLIRPSVVFKRDSN